MTTPHMDESVLGWILKNKIKNERGAYMEFDEHFFLLEPMSNWFPKQVCMKSAQVGWSTLSILKSLYGARYKGLNCIYTLPTFDDVRDFVPAKVNGMIQQNPALVNEIGTSDAVYRKQVGENFIYYRGTQSQKAAIMHTSDLNIYDELDASKLEIVDLYSSRLQKSKYKGEWKFSNPIRPGGIDKEYERSDMRRWMIKCGRCNHQQHMEWLKNVCPERAAYVCQKCDQALSEDDRHDGIWVPEKPSRSNRIQGYHVNQLMAPWVSAKDLLYLEETKSDVYFHSMILGLPYIDQNEVIDSGMIEQNIKRVGNNKLRNAMGVDVKYREKHYVIGNHQGIFEVGVIKGKGRDAWRKIEALIRKYNALTVVDMNPDFYVRQELIPKFPGQVFACVYKKDKFKKNLVKWGAKKERGSVYTDRSQIIQHVVNKLATKKMPFTLGTKQATAYIHGLLKIYIQHWENIYKTTETDNMGIEISRWEKKGGADDDFVHATCYFEIALSKVAEIVIDPFNAPEGVILSPDVLDGTMPADKIPILAEESSGDEWLSV